ncbi:MAG: DUF1211 domain-containing protein [Saprospiraceae bacterium]|nr:MAG: hypothetical protein UZ09_BCD002002482 [Bacteroidetes bacterium OLB9]MCO6464656.1 DUF1211 domain-containing protein [Saprospiraceae bacterium]MCZ2339173.1 TMEM175 family protein [Chitinophagales bacterium]
MSTNRLEAFSDGVFAIIITIMVLELKIPENSGWEELLKLLPVFLTYIISFIYVGIYWNNHHHLFQIGEKVNGQILWANLHLLFWLSLMPFATGYMGHNHFEPIPTALYGFVLFMNATAWEILAQKMIKFEGQTSQIAQIYKGDKKKYISIILYLLGIGLSFFAVKVALFLYFLVAILWIIPDKRFENQRSS